MQSPGTEQDKDRQANGIERLDRGTKIWYNHLWMKEFFKRASTEEQQCLRNFVEKQRPKNVVKAVYVDFDQHEECPEIVIHLTEDWTPPQRDLNGDIADDFQVMFEQFLNELRSSIDTYNVGDNFNISLGYIHPELAPDQDSISSGDTQ